MNRRIIIAAICARPYVQAAVKAGFEVVAIDIFADEETRHNAAETHIINSHDDGLDATELLELLTLIVKTNDIFCFGAGFERQPILLKKIAKLLPVLGNTPLTVHHANTAKLFFASLHNLSLTHPEVSFSGLKSTKNWLQKQSGGSGGGHITRALPLQDIPPKLAHYYQREVIGVPVSLLFLATDSDVHMIGFNKQWCAGTALNPYRYGGAVSQTDLAQSIKGTILDAANKIAKDLKLIGINSLDCIVDGEIVWILELNARLSATLDLYENTDGDLFSAHIAACLGSAVELPVLSQSSNAHHVIYANEGCVVPVNMGWPDYVLDRPVAGSIIEAGQPLCTVFARAENAEAAQQVVAEYAESL